MSDARPGTRCARVLPWLLCLSACRTPTLYDVDLRPVEHPALVAKLEGGQLAIDTSGPDPRAILELYVEVEARDASPTRPPVPWLRCAREGGHAPVRVRWSDPICPARTRKEPVCRAVYNDPARCRDPSRAGLCYYLLRAEYRFDRAPEPGESIAVGLAFEAPAVRWIRR